MCRTGADDEPWPYRASSPARRCGSDTASTGRIHTFRRRSCPCAYVLHRRGDTLGVVVGGEDVEPRLGDEVDPILGAAVHLGVTALAAEPADVHDGHPVHVHRQQRVLHVVELEGLDDGNDQLHVRSFQVRSSE
jgi:hypothetical protein